MNFPHARHMAVSRGPFFALIAAKRRDLRNCGAGRRECAGAHRLQWEGLRHGAHRGASASKPLARGERCGAARAAAPIGQLRTGISVSYAAHRSTGDKRSLPRAPA